MKVAYLSIGLLALLSPLTAAWSKEGKMSAPARTGGVSLRARRTSGCDEMNPG